MMNSVLFDKDLIARYEQSGPRYTSYPTAVHFHDGFNADHYVNMARRTNEDLIPSSLSLYFHLPFCSQVCFYCACNKIITRNRLHAATYLAILHREIALQGRLFDRDRVVDQLHWGGGTPTFINHSQMRELMAVTRDNFTLRKDDHGDYSIEIDPREVEEDTIAVLREIGFNRMSVGVQDFNPDVQKAVNRIQTMNQTSKVIHAARREGFHSINVDLIYGLPKQTVESFHDTLNLIIELNPDRIAVYNYAHLPQLFKTQRQINEKDLPDADERLDILQHAVDYLIQQGYVYIGMDHFAKPDDELSAAQQNGSLHRNFQGYSTHADCDIVGMGITAISRIGQCYAQNVRSLDEYEDNVNHGRIPILRGIKLDDDDRLRREVIIRLICNFHIEYSDIEETYGIDFEDYFYDELILLNKMEKDGLLSLNTESITVSPKGRLLIRNICMVFDKYLHSNQSSGTFSKVI
ncbi:MAG: oxygen-independent coproporphyrinogen III oxidase [Gammaproteobacteria bacterium]|nr:oxygen-independent coproporphyrinogen III oxidase [Gammaproteobacteria bacterium]